MKKIIIAGLTACAVLLSLSAQASNPIPDVAITTAAAECPLLESQVRVNLSNRVVGQYNCDVATNTIQIATCHEGGSRAARDITCAVVGQDENGVDVTNMAGCTVSDVTPNVIGFGAFIAASSGGGVAPSPLDGACTNASLAALGFFF